MYVYILKNINLCLTTDKYSSFSAAFPLSISIKTRTIIAIYVVTARCEYFGTCGGCSTQHVPYEVMLKNKQQLVFNLLKKSRVELATIPEIEHADEYHYRNRMDFLVTKHGLAQRQKSNPTSYVPITHCPISNASINKLVSEVNEWLSNQPDLEAYDFKTKRGTVKFCLIRAPDFSNQTTLSFVLDSQSQKKQEHIDMITSFATHTSSDNVVIAISIGDDQSTSTECFAVKGSLYLSENMNDNVFTFHSQGFFQNNSVMAKKMLDSTKQILQKYPTRDAFLGDIYGGVGVFGITNADLFSQVLIIESYCPSIDSAQKNIADNAVLNARALCADASILSKEVPNNKPLFLILDPPRSGMSEKAIKQVMDLEPQAIVYISCNPQALAKEMKRFTKKYTIESIKVFDLFPQTNHIETIVELKKK